MDLYGQIFLNKEFAAHSTLHRAGKMEASIHLRAKDFAAHERWLANLADVITSNGLDDLCFHPGEPADSNSGGGETE